MVKLDMTKFVIEESFMEDDFHLGGPLPTFPEINVEECIRERNLLPISFLEAGIQRAKSVAFIKKKKSGATGFLIAKDILLTNNHVFPGSEVAKECEVIFNFENDLNGNPKPIDVYTCNPEDFFYTNPTLDFSLVRINKKKTEGGLLPRENKLLEDSIVFPGERWGYTPLISREKVDIGSALIIIQHPEMRAKEIAVHDSKIIIPEKESGTETDSTDQDLSMIVYTTDTEAGSSGSPIYNVNWDLVGLHRGSTKFKEEPVNVGVNIAKIVNDLITPSKIDKKIIFELGLGGLEECHVEGRVDTSGRGEISFGCRF